MNTTYKSNNNVVYSCKYHVVWCPKYRRKVLINGVDVRLKELLTEYAANLSVDILEMEIMPDHVHMFVSIPPKYSVSEIMGYLKGKSSLMIFDRHANLKYKYGNRHFWCRGYYVDTVGKNAKKIEEYVKNQMQEDLEYDQMSLKEYIDPFTGEPVNKA